MSTKRTIPCDHCGKPATLNRLKLFRTKWQEGQRVRPGRTAYMVHADCWSAFELKLARQMDLESFVHEHARAGWIMRAFVAPTVWQKMRRLHGTRRALVAVSRWLFRKP